METEGVNSEAQYVIGRSARSLATVQRIVSDGKEHLNIWRRAVRMNAGNTDVAAETLQINKRCLGVAREAVEANIGNIDASRKTIRQLAGIYIR